MHFHFEDSCLFFKLGHHSCLYCLCISWWFLAKGLVGDLLQGYIMYRGYLFIICSSRGRQLSSISKALFLVAGHPAHHFYFYYFYFIVSSKWGNSDVMHIFVYEEPTLWRTLAFSFLERWVNGRGNHLHCLFPLWPVECSCELAGWLGDLGLWRGIKQVFKPIPWQEVKATRTLPAEHIWRYV